MSIKILQEYNSANIESFLKTGSPDRKFAIVNTADSVEPKPVIVYENNEKVIEMQALKSRDDYLTDIGNGSLVREKAGKPLAGSADLKYEWVHMHIDLAKYKEEEREKVREVILHTLRNPKYEAVKNKGSGKFEEFSINGARQVIDLGIHDNTNNPHLQVIVNIHAVANSPINANQKILNKSIPLMEGHIREAEAKCINKALVSNGLAPIFQAGREVIEASFSTSQATQQTPKAQMQAVEKAAQQPTGSTIIGTNPNVEVNAENAAAVFATISNQELQDIAKQEAELHKKKLEIQARNALVQKAQAFDKVNSENENNKGIIATLTDKIAGYVEQIKTLGAELLGFKEENKTLKDDLKSSNNDRDNFLEQAQIAEKERDTLRNEKVSWAKIEQELKSAKEQLLKEVAEKDKTIDGKNKTIAQQKEEAEKKKEEHFKEIGKQELINENLTKQVRELQEKLSSQAKELEETKEKINKLNEQNKKLEETLKKFEKFGNPDDFKQAVEDNKTLKSDAAKLEKKLEASQAINDKFDKLGTPEKIAKALEEVPALKAENKELKEDNSKLSGQVQSLATALDKATTPAPTGNKPRQPK